MTLYEIDRGIRSLVDSLTGEVTDYELLDNLVVEREQKLKAIALLIKEKNHFIESIDEEIERLNQMKKSESSSVEWLKNYFSHSAPGETIKDPSVTVSWRKSESVEVEDSDALCKWLEQNGKSDLLTVKHSVAPNKTAIKAELKNGADIPGAVLAVKQNLQVR